MERVVLNRKQKKTIFIVLMLLFPLLQFTVFTLFVNFNTFVMAFQTFDYETNTVKFVGWENLRTFFIEFSTTTMWKRAIVNSLGYFPITVFISLPLTIIISYFLYNKIFLSNVYKVIFYIPNIISVVVMGLVFRSLFSYSSGPINLILMNVFGVARDNIPVWFNDPNVTMNVIYFYAIWAGLGGNIILVIGAMSRVPKELCEAGELDGVGIFRELVQIYVPIIWPTVSTLIIFGTTAVFTMFVHTAVLTDGAGASWTMASILMTKVKQNKDPYYVAMLSLMLTIIAVPVIELVKYITGKIYADVEI